MSTDTDFCGPRRKSSCWFGCFSPIPGVLPPNGCGQEVDPFPSVDMSAKCRCSFISSLMYFLFGPIISILIDWLIATLRRLYVQCVTELSGDSSGLQLPASILQGWDAVGANRTVVGAGYPETGARGDNTVGDRSRGTESENKSPSDME